MGDTDGWRRAALDYRSKFEEDFVFSVPGALEGAPPLRIAQAPSATAAEKRVGCLRPAAPADRRGAGSSSRGSGPASSSSPAVSDDAEDPIPATGFTVWDAGVLLGAYVSQPEVWRRLTTASDVPPRKLEAKLDAMASTRSTLRGLSLTGSNEPVSDTTVLELGAGTGVAGLALASTGLPSAVALTDLPGVCAFLRHNAARNKAAPPPRDGFGKNRKIVGKSQKRIEPEPLVAAIPADVAVAVAPLRWGAETDVANLTAAFRNPRVVLGADLAYTENAAVVEKLAATVRACVPRGGVAVFASCRDHRPETSTCSRRSSSRGAFRRGACAETTRAGVRAAGAGTSRRRRTSRRRPKRRGSLRFHVVGSAVAGTPCRPEAGIARVTRAEMRGSLRFGSL